ncbi:unnamed protein product [Closterium sp. Yama58-4]|nr:unnamed protein product [Closterium sp. Yama58-4]
MATQNVSRDALSSIMDDDALHADHSATSSYEIRLHLESQVAAAAAPIAGETAAVTGNAARESGGSAERGLTVVDVDLGDRSYPIYIGVGILDRGDLLCRHVKGRRVLVVTNETIAPLYLERTIAALTHGNPQLEVRSVVLPDGEQFKDLETLNLIFDRALETRMDRRCTFVALGGGVIGDMTGFAAASYLRGVNFIQIPTTVMAQVDSSVGGKTGVNHRLGKNMIGAFYQPQCVLIDTDTLASLPDRELASGLAEVIKYGLIRDAEFFVWQEQNMDRLLARDPAALAFAIKRSCENKAAVVAADEKEGGLRATLNLGHTFGHAIENGLGYGEWLHGEAVAAGTVMAAHMSHRMGWIDAALRDRITAIIKKARLPTRPPSAVTKEQFRSLMAVDKKVADGQLRLILLKGSLGDCVFTGDFDKAALEATLDEFSPEAELVVALAGAVAKSQANILASVSSSIGDAVTRVQKLIQPSPPGLPPGPADDSAVRLASDPLTFLDDVAQDYPGGIATVRLVGEPVLVISNPELAREVLVTQSDVFIKAGTAFFPGSSLTGNGLLVSDGEVWKRQRRLSNAAFRKAAIQSYATAMAELADDMVGGTWTGSITTTRPRGVEGRREGGGRGGGDSVVRDVYADFNELTMRIVVAALFGGGGLGGAAVEQVGPAISTAFEFFAKRATSMLIIPEWFPTPDNLQYTAAVQRLDGVVYRLIEERRKEMAGWAGGGRNAQGGSEEGKDLLTRLLLARDEDGSGMDDQSLRDELMTLLVAGQETSAILLAWVCVQLALHPEEQRRAEEEVRQVLGGRIPTHADVPKLKYLESVIQETLRLMPPAYIVGRCACRETHLGQWRVPQGTTVLVSPYLLHRDPQHWPRALAFDPSRWLPGGDALPPADNPSYWPFGGGPRNCIGMGFALLEASIVLARILQSFSLSLPTGSPPPVPRAMITLRPAGEVNLLLTPLASHASEEKVPVFGCAGTGGQAAAEPAGTAAAPASQQQQQQQQLLQQQQQQQQHQHQRRQQQQKA